MSTRTDIFRDLDWRDVGAETGYLDGPVPHTVRKQDQALRTMDIRCGTTAGHRQHIAEGSMPCGQCNDALRLRVDSDPRPRPHCGSNTGWRSHRRAGERPCRSCEIARAHYVDGTHGTYKGWMLHRHLGTPVCEPCRLARNRYQNGRPRNRKSRSGK